MSLQHFEAVTRVGFMVAVTEEPTLSAANLSDLVRFSKIVDRLGFAPDAFDDWAPTTAYTVGQIVAPKYRNQPSFQAANTGAYISTFVWICTVAGTSAGTEPAWPTGATTVPYGSGYSTTTPVVGVTTKVDGGVTWTAYATTSWSGAWDLNHAAAEGWRRKAALCANAYQVVDSGKQLFRQQMHEHCLKMSKEYGSKVFASYKVRRADWRGSLGHYDPNTGTWVGGGGYLEGAQPGRLIPGVETNWDY